jgi:hypothetical protein
MPLTPTEQKEAQARAAMEQAPGGNTAVRERARKIREEVAKKGAGEAIKSFVEPPHPESDAREKSIDDRLGWEREANGKKLRPPGSPAEAIFNDAKKADELPSKIIEKGYDSLDPTEKNIARAEADKALRERIPDLADVILGPPGSPVANYDAILDGMLRDPKFRDTLRTTHRGSLNSDVIKTTEVILKAAKDTLDQKTEADKKIDDEIKQLNQNLENANKVIDGFAAKNVGTEGTDAYRLNELETQEPAIQAEIVRLRPKIESINNTLGQLRKMAATERMKNGVGSPLLATINGEITTQEAELKAAVGELGAQEALLTKKANLIAKRNKAEEDKTSTEEKLEDAKTRKADAAREKLAAQAEFDRLKLTREDEEAKYLKGLQGSTKEAVVEYIKKRLEEAQSVESEVLQAEAREAEDGDKKKVLEALAKDGLKWNLKKKRNEQDKARALERGKLIVNPSEGLDKVIQEYLTDGVATGTPEHDRLMAKMKDTEFLKTMREKVGPTLVGRYLQAGGRFSEADVIYLRGTDWGQNLIENGLKEQEAVVKAIEDLKGKGALNKSFFERLKSVDNKTWLTILILILAGVAVAGVAPAAGAITKTIK